MRPADFSHCLYASCPKWGLALRASQPGRGGAGWASDHHGPNGKPLGLGWLCLGCALPRGRVLACPPPYREPHPAQRSATQPTAACGRRCTSWRRTGRAGLWVGRGEAPAGQATTGCAPSLRHSRGTHATLRLRVYRFSLSVRQCGHTPETIPLSRAPIDSVHSAVRPGPNPPRSARTPMAISRLSGSSSSSPGGLGWAREGCWRSDWPA